uniref:Uncharacterized protein n=1 Tax=Eutreptiella gymnastica TaxID=73025 RepID=A0A7S4D2D2_9EUGL
MLSKCRAPSHKSALANKSESSPKGPKHKSIYPPLVSLTRCTLTRWAPAETAYCTMNSFSFSNYAWIVKHTYQWRLHKQPINDMWSGALKLHPNFRVKHTSPSELSILVTLCLVLAEKRNSNKGDSFLPLLENQNAYDT